MSDVVLDLQPLGFAWPAPDPFLFCVHHVDAYPRGNDALGPAAALDGRAIGQDFVGKDGWRMYHGDQVPGFPAHPHRGFETITFVRRGLVDHADSLGASARYGAGDVQWLTAGRGIVHAELFPLVERTRDNPVELFQIWLNLPRADKLAEPWFAMHWADRVPRVVTVDEAGRTTEITVVAGEIAGAVPAPPPPSSWATRPDTDVAIWSIRMAPGARTTLPPARPGTNRTLFFFDGSALTIAGRAIPPNHGATLRADVEAPLEAGPDGADLLVLQGRPIGEPVAQHGPFVMTTPAEVQQAFADYRRTRFGGWPWPTEAPVHPADAGRFATRPDHTTERPDANSAFPASNL